MLRTVQAYRNPQSQEFLIRIAVYWFVIKRRKKVLEAAEELGYVPNAIAQTMASGRSRIIGIVVPSNYNIFHYHILQIFNQCVSNVRPANNGIYFSADR